MHITTSIRHEVNHYVIRNIMASLGLSFYVLADSIFIAKAAGALGLATLNIVLPIFNLYGALGLLLGVGGAAIFSMNKITHPKKVQDLYSQLFWTCLGLGLLVALLCNLFPQPILKVMGATAQTMDMAAIYLRIVSLGAPLFMLNYLTINFIRNDGNPQLTMIATLSESVFVVLVDWILIFGLGLKMEGAALATLFSPSVSLLILSRHKNFAQRQLQLHWCLPQFSQLWHAAKLGFPAFLNEMSTGVSIFAFNVVLLKLAGNYAISAYGIIANIAVLVLSAFNGVALGVQPIASREYGKKNYLATRQAITYGLFLVSLLGLGIYLFLFSFRAPIIAVFNEEGLPQLVKYAMVGLPLYFTMNFFTGPNLLISTSLAATNQAQAAFSLSLLRGYLILLPMIFIGANFGLTGVWLSTPLTELLTLLVALCLLRKLFISFKRKELLNHES
ncbi:MATE family efflux transporter [Ligilactobacillus equi]|uniref:MATE efflux family protein n=1 Tax=Ligilactobacillus equi DPC 6820 TaxID=1392007 RepID=V7HX83_9LACO|nr:MATE family efflux transporter [Ligilactobacillus equi]ETA73661.1 MATE efflux family protein [Ligilactobacillus equi DPC 6820]